MNFLSLIFGLTCNTMQTSCCTFRTKWLKTGFQSETISSTSWTVSWENTLRRSCSMQMSREQVERPKQKQTRPSKSTKNGGTNFKPCHSSLVSLNYLVTFFSSQGPHHSPSEAKFKNSSSVTKEKKSWNSRVFELVERLETKLKLAESVNGHGWICAYWVGKQF